MNTEVIGRFAFENRERVVPDISIDRYRTGIGLRGGMDNPEWRKAWCEAAAAYCRLFSAKVMAVAAECVDCGAELDHRQAKRCAPCRRAVLNKAKRAKRRAA